MSSSDSIVLVRFKKLCCMKTYAALIMESDEKKFAIYIDPKIGYFIQDILSGAESERPQTHDLIGYLCKGLEISFKHLIIDRYEDKIFHSKLLFRQQIGDIEHILKIDARPSDGIALAIVNKAPVYCAQKVIDSVVDYIE